MKLGRKANLLRLCSWSIIIGLVIVAVACIAAWVLSPKGETQTYVFDTDRPGSMICCLARARRRWIVANVLVVLVFGAVPSSCRSRVAILCGVCLFRFLCPDAPDTGLHDGLVSDIISRSYADNEKQLRF
jgi:hypothetical protein